MSPDSVQSARAAGLRYVCDDRPGIRRRMGALGFEYFRPDGRRIRRPAELRRLAKLAIPPAWKDVWICPDPRGHLQATGRDARGRKQYRYHPAWRAARDETKYYRLLAFAAVLPAIRTRTAADLARAGLPREKVLATVVQLLDKSFMRIGNQEYEKQNRSFGLTTLKDRHVDVRGSTLRFEFKGKRGIRHSVDVADARLARVVKHCRDLPGQELFQYVDEDGRRRTIGSGDVNDYVKALTGQDFTAKDFRTWAGTVLACAALSEMDAPASSARRTRPVPTRAPTQVVRAIDAVAGLLGNTRAVCRKSYIHPGIIDAYVDGTMRPICERLARASRRRGWSRHEAAVVAILRRAAQSGRAKAA